MENPKITYRETVDRLSSRWLSSGLPSRQALDAAADELEHLRDRLNVRGLWERPPVMLTATLDDGLGQGLAVIEKFAAAIGMRLIRLGLMQSPEIIIAACRQHHPDYLGMTVLQFDSEDDLIDIVENLPPGTRLIAGGPVYSGDADFAARTKTHYAAENVVNFLRFMLRTVHQRAAPRI